MPEQLPPLESPVAFAVFRRPAETAQVFAAIAATRPTRLFVFADGPRSTIDGEVERCAAVRRVVERVDWACDVKTDFAASNLGCRRRIATGLDWVFSQVESAIILEDDCLPHPTFFRFCDELLARYRDDDRVSYISGNNFQGNAQRAPRAHPSYTFSKYGSAWGWASWRRSWRDTDVALSDWPSQRARGILRDLLDDRIAALDYTEALDATLAEEIDTWDYQFALAGWMHHRLSVVPSVNLVSNIGFTTDATHTHGESPLALVPVEPMPFPLVHPTDVAADGTEDRRVHAQYFGPRWQRARHHLKRRLAALLRTPQVPAS